MIGIIDYDMGNLYSVSKALERLEIPYFISKNIDELMEADGYILPGVGAFPDAMKTLQETGLQAFLDTKVYQKKPLLGICLGMQLLFESSEEYGQTRGLAYLPGTVERFSGTTLNGDAYKVPHMGWNELVVKKKAPIVQLFTNGHVYFVHSYVVQTDSSVVVAESNYHQAVPAIVQEGMIYGMQFHPEKSGDVGMNLLKQYGQLVKERKV
ncbi:imidazole glycerol phosphate synthase amidotransferase subunit [Bacillus sp. JCM 19046]|nr:imidazole glycerol phosphate synthase amidotransferase subunit [Bacillus sp. JCM 19045]GAF18395.1 imidazole glycerol phosphate synthase amidotransferase subunit [Bacillus sp. JCM 19046]